MKKFLILIISFILIFVDFSFVYSEENIATPSNTVILVNGEEIKFDAYLINDNNYFKLRDFAMAINKTKQQFNIDWNGETKVINLTLNESYIPVGGELEKSNQLSNIPLLSEYIIYCNNLKYNILGYMINGNNFFKLRDIAFALDIIVDWNDEAKTVIIDSEIMGHLEEIEVTNTEEFINAVGSNRILRVKEGTYDLTDEILRNIENKNVEWDYSGLNIINTENLCIAGEINRQSKFIINAKLFNILSFVDCNNIKIENLNIVNGAQSEKTYQVTSLSFERTNNVKVNNCFLGNDISKGVVFQNGNYLAINNTVITDCDYCAIHLYKSSGIAVNNTEITKNRGYSSLIIAFDAKVEFNNCEISENKALRNEIIQAVCSSNIRFNNCTINDNEGPDCLVSNLEMLDGWASTLTFKECKFINNIYGELDAYDESEYINCIFEDNIIKMDRYANLNSEEG